MTLVPIQRRRIPVLPARPRVRPFAGEIHRSYPVGRHSFSRASQGQTLELTIAMEAPLPDSIRARLVTTLNSNGNSDWAEIPFVRTDEQTLTCCLVPERPGLHSFRAEFSLDHGAVWLRDSVPDAWVLIDPPQVDALRIYTFIPTVSGTIADWKTDIPRIAEMGFNTIHLLPVTPLDGSESPYAARDLFGVDPSYLEEGTGRDGLSQLEDYVAAAAAQNVRLCFDLVLNHVGVTSNMALHAPDWIVQDQNQPDGLQRARYWSDDGWRTWNDLVLINYEHPSEAMRAEIWTYMIDYALFWAHYADATGGFVRFDNLHSGDPDFLQALTAALRAAYPNLGVLAEYFTDERTLLHTGPQWGLNLIMATPWDYKFVPQLREYLVFIHRVSEHVRYFMPLTSHDSGTPTQEFGTPESTIPRYVAAALLGTGATGIPQGVEFAVAERIAFIGRKPKMSFPAEARFGLFIGRVNAILAENPAFRRGGNCRFVDDGHPSILAAFRRDTQTDAFGFLVVCNFDIGSSQSIVVDLTSVLGTDGPFPCCELISGETQVFPSSRLEFHLQPCSAQVLKFPGIRKPLEEMQSP